MQTTITVTDRGIIITGPYSDNNNALWKELGGRFQEGSWVLPDSDTARGKVAELFGAKSEEVEVLVPYEKVRNENGKIVQFGGYVLAQRRGRDYPVQMPDGVSLAAGAFKRYGGSVKNPSVALDSDVVFRLRCRRAFAEANGLEIAPAPTPSTIEI